MVWKRYGVPLNAIFKDGLRRLGGRRPIEPTWALRDISFELRAGESLGIIGRNGAGKSTLLKVLAGVTPATRGRIVRQCRMFPMIELNAGVHLDLTGRENIYVLGAIMGLSRRDMNSKVDEILGFSELGDAIDRPARTYSTGMLTRLGFSVAVHVDADVLLIDEVLSVGDLAFQRKCLAAIDRVRHQGTAIIFVSHSPYQVERTCADVMLLEGGRIALRGSASSVMHEYFGRLVQNGSLQEIVLPDADDRPGCGDLRLTSIRFLNPDRTQVTLLCTGQPLLIQLHYRAKCEMSMPNVKLRVMDPYNTIVAGLDSLRFKPAGRVIGEGIFECSISAVELTANNYSINVQVKGSLLLDEVAGIPLTVVSDAGTLIDTGSVGTVHLPARWSIRQNHLSCRVDHG